MASKWINKDKFKNFQNQKTKESEQKTNTMGNLDRSIVWPTPEKGTQEKPKVYELRFLSDQEGNFYEKYMYHMFRVGEKWVFMLCEKTFDMDNFCPFCEASSKLYMGSKADKAMAYNFKRKEKYVTNIFVVDDPRDVERDVPFSGKNMIYEFPWKVEMKIRSEITDSKHGLGISIFDPGKDGFNFLLKVLSTKPDPEKRVFPDYSMSEFSRRSSSIGSDDEIEKIMSQTYNLNEYIKNMRRSDDDIVSTLKRAMIWELVENEWNESRGLSTRDSSSTSKEDRAFGGQFDGKIEENKDDDVPDVSDDELLAELENI